MLDLYSVFLIVISVILIFIESMFSDKGLTYWRTGGSGQEDHTVTEMKFSNTNFTPNDSEVPQSVCRDLMSAHPSVFAGIHSCLLVHSASDLSLNTNQIRDDTINSDSAITPNKKYMLIVLARESLVVDHSNEDLRSCVLEALKRHIIPGGVLACRSNMDDILHGHFQYEATVTLEGVAWNLYVHLQTVS